MPSALETEALSAYNAILTAEEAARESARKTLRAAATDALRTILVKNDGTRLTITEAGLSVKDTDLDAGRVVWSDGTISLASIFRSGEWRVFLVTLADGQWTRESERLKSIADLGKALAALPKPVTEV